MIERIRYIWQLLVLTSILVLTGLLLISLLDLNINPYDFLVTAGAVMVVNLITYLIMYKGILKNDREGMVYLLGGIGVKFLLYLLYILLFWSVSKNLTKPFIVTFFALYLVFTFFTAGRLLKLLKNK
jgi:hypothetical protein